MRKHRDLLRITEVRSCCYFLLTASNVVDPNASRCPAGSTPLRSAQDDGKRRERVGFPEASVRALGVLPQRWMRRSMLGYLKLIVKTDKKN